MKYANKIIAVDLDDTLCYRPEGIEHLGKEKYLQCLPIESNISFINNLSDAGHTIIIYTARGMYTFRMDVEEVYRNLFKLTSDQLQQWGVKYTKLVMGKYPYDYLLDDKALSLREMDRLKPLFNKVIHYGNTRS